MVKLIKESIAEAFPNAASQPFAGTQGEESASMSKDIKELKKGQKELEVEKRISALKTEGAQSQYRTIAFMGLRLDSACEKIDELSLSLEDPDDPTYMALSSIKDDLLAAHELGKERLDLITKADSEPNVGWKALTKYEQAVQNSKSSNPEREKLFSECVKKVNEEKKKKSKVTAPQLAASLNARQFRSGPGYSSGYNSFGAKQGTL